MKEDSHLASYYIVRVCMIWLTVVNLIVRYMEVSSSKCLSFWTWTKKNKVTDTINFVKLFLNCITDTQI